MLTKINAKSRNLFAKKVNGERKAIRQLTQLTRSGFMQTDVCEFRNGGGCK